MEIKIISADETKIRELENDSAFTWVGLSGLEQDKEIIVNCFNSIKYVQEHWKTCNVEVAIWSKMAR